MRRRIIAAPPSSSSIRLWRDATFPTAMPLDTSIKVPESGTRIRHSFLPAPGRENGVLIVGVVADKLDDGLSKPILPEAFVPYTVAMGMYTQILVRSEVPPLTLLHAVRAKVNSVDHDQQTNGDVRDLEHWIRGRRSGRAGSSSHGSLAHSRLWRWRWRLWGCTAWSLTPSCSAPTSSEFASRWARSEAMCSALSFVPWWQRGSGHLGGHRAHARAEQSDGKLGRRELARSPAAARRGLAFSHRLQRLPALLPARRAAAGRPDESNPLRVSDCASTDSMDSYAARYADTRAAQPSAPSVKRPAKEGIIPLPDKTTRSTSASVAGAPLGRSGR